MSPFSHRILLMFYIAYAISLTQSHIAAYSLDLFIPHYTYVLNIPEGEKTKSIKREREATKRTIEYGFICIHVHCTLYRSDCIRLYRRAHYIVFDLSSLSKNACLSVCVYHPIGICMRIAEYCESEIQRNRLTQFNAPFMF